MQPNDPLSFTCLLKNCFPALPVGLGLGSITVQRGKSCGTEDFFYNTPQVTVSVTLAWLIFLLANDKCEEALNVEL